MHLAESSAARDAKMSRHVYGKCFEIESCLAPFGFLRAPIGSQHENLGEKCRQWFPKVEICGLRENVCFFLKDAILYMFGTPGVLQMGTAGALMGNSKRSTWTAFQHRHSRLISE